MCRNLAANFGNTAQLGRPVSDLFPSATFHRPRSACRSANRMAASHEMDMAVNSSCLSVASGSFMKSKARPVLPRIRFFQVQQAVLGTPCRPKRYVPGARCSMNSVNIPTSYASFHSLRHVAEDAFPLGTAFPVRDHLPLVRVDVFLADRVTLQLPGVQDMQVLHAMAGKFREGRHGTSGGAPARRRSTRPRRYRSSSACRSHRKFRARRIGIGYFP